jgi:hypothetical protein
MRYASLIVCLGTLIGCAGFGSHSRPCERAEAAPVSLGCDNAQAAPRVSWLSWLRPSRLWARAKGEAQPAVANPPVDGAGIKAGYRQRPEPARGVAAEGGQGARELHLRVEEAAEGDSGSVKAPNAPSEPDAG